MTPLTQPDGTAFTGQNLDGEGLVALEDGSVLASSETESAIRRFSPAGRQIEQLPVPDRLRVAPAGDATTNLTFEGLGLSPGGRALWAGTEGPLAPDGLTAAGACSPTSATARPPARRRLAPGAIRCATDVEAMARSRDGRTL